jgi:hypothetical protein
MPNPPLCSGFGIRIRGKVRDALSYINISNTIHYNDKHATGVSGGHPLKGMYFETISEIENTETIAIGGKIRDIMRIRKQYGLGH